MPRDKDIRYNPELDINTDYGKMVIREFFDKKHDHLTIKEFRKLMHLQNSIPKERHANR